MEVILVVGEGAVSHYDAIEQKVDSEFTESLRVGR